MSQAPMLDVQNLVKKFGAVLATDHVSLQVQQNEIHALIGPNGAGKTSLFRMIIGQEQILKELVAETGKTLDWQTTAAIQAILILVAIMASIAYHWLRDLRGFLDRPVVIVGGTGLYLKVLLEGIAPIPEIDPAVRAAVRALDEDAAYKLLQVEDPERAADLDPGDRLRFSRAIEV